ALTIDELDIENIVRAKAAIYSACALMLDQVEMSFEDLSTIYIAGGFGRFLDLEKAIILGLIPDIDRSKFKYIGNSSLMGSYMVAVSQEFREKQMAIAGRMTYMELSTDPAYMDQYTGALFLPHTDPTLFPTVTETLKGVQG
ncbi:MAG: ASKHA domain-containing protein, partial [Planctomycetota bacterium]